MTTQSEFTYQLLVMLQRYDQLNYSPCRLDHNGDCQEHFMEHESEGCTVKMAHDLLEELKPREYPDTKGNE